MSVVEINTDPTRRQLNQFGFIWMGFIAFFGVIGLYKFHNPSLARGLWVAAVVVPIAGWIFPRFMRWVFLGMSYLAFPIGFVVSHVVLAVVYYLVLTPIGLLTRLVGYDSLPDDEKFLLEVARLFRCSWVTVAASVDFVVKYGLENRDLSGITHIGIDEIPRRKGHKYFTNVYDLKTKRLIWSGKGRTEETLKECFDFLGENRAKQLQGICCDMWVPYFNVIENRAPNAVLVFDKFHIVRHLMNAVDQVRRDEIREKGKEHKELVKRTRYLWLKNPWNLKDDQKARLSALEKLNLKINRAYLLKEAFRDLWSYTKPAWATKYLQKWFWWATHSRLKPMRDFAWLVRRHEENILSYFHLPIDNGSVEGLNNKAKVISHRAYGFRSAKNYILNLYHCMADLPMPNLLHSFM